ncbi:MAG: hypothetical protein IAE94_03950 [Chthoniobacterales bacterium]|nr:hypothetical protein [Chthoniobacterales bacterium]
MHLLSSFLFSAAVVFCGLAMAAVFTRVAFAVTEKITFAPVLDFFISLFTWLPWVAGLWLSGWIGLLAALFAQVVFLHAFCLTHRALRGKKGRTLTDAQARLLGPVRNQLCLLLQTPAVLVFALVRLAEILLYPSVARLGRLPTYKSSEWVNLSRHKYDGLIGYDLLWCWYCDWMTGVWALGSEMLRNIESFWCPIQFRDPRKNRNVSTDFPDIAKWAPADGTMEDAVRAFEAHYDGRRPNSWWGHPDRNSP